MSFNFSSKPDPNMSGIPRLEVSFILINKTLLPVVRWGYRQSDKAPDNSSQTAAVVFLFIIFFAVFVLGLLYLAAFLSSYSLHRLAVMNVFFFIVAACVFDAVANVSVSIAYKIRDAWNFGYILCSVNAYFMLAVSSIISWAIGALALDRFWAVSSPIVYKKKLKTWYVRLGIVIIWLIMFGIHVPICLLGPKYNIPSLVPFPRRYSCGVNGNTYLLYMQMLLALGHGVPLVCIALGFLRMLWLYWQKCRSGRTNGRNRNNENTNNALIAQLWTEMRYVHVGTAVIIVYFCLYLPHVLTVHIFQITTPAINTTTSPIEAFIDEIFLSQEEEMALRKYETQFNAVYRAVYGNNSVLHLEPAFDNGRQTPFIWMRYFFLVLVPILIYAMIPEVREKATYLLCAWRRDARDRMASARPYDRQAALKAHRMDMSFKRAVDIRTPVLFATDEGLYLRTLDEDNMQSTNVPTFLCQFCDVSKFNDGTSSAVLGEEISQAMNEVNSSAKSTRSVRSVRSSTDVIAEVSPVREKPKSKKMVRFAEKIIEIKRMTATFEEDEFPFYKNDDDDDEEDITPKNNRISPDRQPIAMTSLEPDEYGDSIYYRETSLPNDPPPALTKKGKKKTSSTSKPSNVVKLSKKKIPIPNFVTNKASQPQARATPQWRY